MRAVVYRNYGDDLRCEDVLKPSPKDDEVLIRVRAAAMNPMDYHLMSGAVVMRPMTGLLEPKMTRSGTDLAGEVEAVGKHVRRFQPGNAVFGVARGAFAEYVCASESRLALKPAAVTFEQAAAIPVAGLTALQALRDKGHLQAGQKILINGAAGGVGTFAVQIAKSLGAAVTGVCSTRSVDLVRSLGADHVIDYTREDFTRSGDRYDVILDCVGNRPLGACRRVMAPKGILIPIGMRPGVHWTGMLARLLTLFVSSWFVSQKIVFFIAAITADDLAALAALIERGKITPVVDKCYAFDQAQEAIRYLKTGHTQGKVVLTVA